MSIAKGAARGLMWELSRAAAWSDPVAAKRVLEAGANACQRDGSGRGSLHWACGARDPRPRGFFASASSQPPEPGAGALEVAKLLVGAGASLSMRDGTGSTPLHWACERGSCDLALWLMEQGADALALDAKGLTPLMRACSAKDAYVAGGVVDALIKKGASLEDRDHSGKAAAHWAARFNPGALAALSKAGADLDAADKNGKTPLHEACAAGRLSCARILLDAGASPALLDAKGKPPSQVGQSKAALLAGVRHEVVEISAASAVPASSKAKSPRI